MHEIAQVLDLILNHGLSTRNSTLGENGAVRGTTLSMYVMLDGAKGCPWSTEHVSKMTTGYILPKLDPAIFAAGGHLSR